MKKNTYYVWIEFLLLLSLVAAIFLVGLKDARFTGDESSWIQQSSHLEDFLKGDFDVFTPKTHKEKFRILTMPTMPEYIIGLSRSIGGYNAADVSKVRHIDDTKTRDENEALGNMAPKDMLGWARLLPALLSVSSILVTFYLLKLSFNWRVAYAWIILTLVNPWLILTLQRAMGEPPLLFFIVMGMLAGFLSLKSFKDDVSSMKHSLFWLILLGVFAGLAGQSKTNGLAVFGAGVVILIVLIVRCQAGLRLRFFSIGLVGLIVSTFIFFVGPNPFLWSDPIGKTIQTFDYRIGYMTGSQSAKDPKRIIDSWNEGLKTAFNQIFVRFTPVQFINAEYLKLLLASLGFVIFLSKTWRSFTPKISSINSGALSIFIVGLFTSIPSLLTPINVARYYLLPVFFASILIAIGFDWFLGYAVKNIKAVSTKIHKPQAAG